MTQLSLFDTPSNVQPSSAPSDPMPTSAPNATSAGPQRMGNLAHLVLARYEMVHRRREAQRRRAQSQALSV